MLYCQKFSSIQSNVWPSQCWHWERAAADKWLNRQQFRRSRHCQWDCVPTSTAIANAFAQWHAIRWRPFLNRWTLWLLSMTQPCEFYSELVSQKKNIYIYRWTALTFSILLNAKFVKRSGLPVVFWGHAVFQAVYWPAGNATDAVIRPYRYNSIQTPTTTILYFLRW